MYLNSDVKKNVLWHFFSVKILRPMKITVFIIAFACMQAVAGSYAQVINLSENNVKLHTVFTQIKKQTNYKFFYKGITINNIKVSANLTNASIDDALTQILKDQPFTYTLVNKTIIIHQKKNFVQVKQPSITKLIDIVVKGKVTDDKNLPIPGVSIRIQGTTKGVQTDMDGNYSISAPEGAVLDFSSIGFVAKSVKITSANLNVTLLTDNQSMREVVVTGYSSQSRGTITTSISKLDARVLENVPYQNVATAMQGTVAGVRVQTVSGQPGAAPRVIVRGGTSINNPNSAIPLYIVDGVIRSDLDNIAAEDIESLQVLKDAAATSIYGARGSNGVVLVKTKSGKSGPTKVTYNYDVTRSKNIIDYNYIGARDYITAIRSSVRGVGRSGGATAENTLLNEQRAYGIGNDLTKGTQATTQYLTAANSYKLNEGWESMPDPVDATKTIIFKNTDFSQYVYQTGISQNHHITITGGSDKATFGAGIGYMSTQGTIRSTDYHRLTMNLNGDIKANDKLSFSGRMTYAGSGDNANRLLGGNPANIALRYAALAPSMKYNYEDGTLAHGRDAGIGNPDYYFPLFNIKGDELQKQKLTLAMGAHWQLLPGLSFDPLVSLYNQEARTDLFQPAYYSGVVARTLNITRATSSSQGSYRQKQADLLLNYKKQFANKHNISAVAGFTYYGRDTTTLNASGRGAATDNIITLNASPTPVSVSSSLSQRNIISFLYGVNYDYQQKYLLTLNGRYDGASNLGDAQKWGFFPGVSLGWNAHEEKFWNFLPPNLLSLKLRASYGENGNISGLGDYDTQGTYTTGAIYLGNSAIVNSLFPNQNLKWEKSKTLDFGTDIGLFNNRISILFDVFRRVTDDLLASLSLPPSTGFGSIRTNYGSLEGKGLELEVSAKIMPATSAFKWQTSFNVATIKNKILKLPPSGVERNRVGGIQIWDPATSTYIYAGGLQEGGRIGDLFAYKQLGVYATDAEAASAPVDMLNGARNNINGKAAGGDVRWQDTDGNGIIDSRDAVYVGNPYPVWTGGFSNYFNYKNLGLSVRMDFATGQTNYNQLQQISNSNGTGDSSPSKNYWEQSWKKQGDVTDVPRYVYLDTKANITRGNSTYYTKGDYLALREVTLSYTIPVKIMQKVKINSLKLNLTGYNLHYFRAPIRNGVIPNNVEDGGTDNGRYALSRDFILGANLTF
jgi:TonB-linked SusC/RagA family outer membrane protein